MDEAAIEKAIKRVENNMDAQRGELLRHINALKGRVQKLESALSAKSITPESITKLQGKGNSGQAKV